LSGAAYCGCGDDAAAYSEDGGRCDERDVGEGLRDAVDDGDCAAWAETEGAASDGHGWTTWFERLGADNELALWVCGDGVAANCEDRDSSRPVIDSKSGSSNNDSCAAAICGNHHGNPVDVCRLAPCKRLVSNDDHRWGLILFILVVGVRGRLARSHSICGISNSHRIARWALRVLAWTVPSIIRSTWWIVGGLIWYALHNDPI
jgi:hypothetical protein